MNKMILDNQPLVSICCITYNHVKYIQYALDSFLMQKTDFPFEICLGEDESNDGTREICEEYAVKYPEKIRLFLRKRSEDPYLKKKLYGKNNFIKTIKKCKGKYIALCEGDDYWTDPYKLQKQVDFLEANEEYSFLFGPANLYNEKTGKFSIRNQYSKTEVSKIDLKWILKKGGGFYPTPTLIFRRDVIAKFPNWFYLHSTGDYPLAIMAAITGKIGYIDQVMSTYRVHGKSLTNNTSIESKKCIKIARQNRDKNLLFINSLLKHGITDTILHKYLQTKENYTFYSKCVNCGNYQKALGGLFSPDLDIYFRLRLIAKLIWSMKKLISI
jgi:glycosyltransferase involved in cell wall biosynthesis